MASTLVLLVALYGVAVARWAQQAGGHPQLHASLWVQAGIQLGTLQGLKSQMPALNMGPKPEQTPRMSPGDV